MPFVVYSKSKAWKEVPSVSYINNDHVITGREISNYVESHGLENGSYFNLNIDDIADEILTSNHGQETTNTNNTNSPSAELLAETASSAQPQADVGTGDTNLDKILSHYLTGERIKAIEEGSSKLNRSSFKALKEDLTLLVCSHIHPEVVEDKDDIVGVEKYTDEDLESVTSIAMLQEFVTSKNTKKRDAIKAAIAKYGRKAVVQYVCIVSTTINVMVWRLYTA